MHNAALFQKRGLQNGFSFLLADSTLLKPGATWPAIDTFFGKMTVLSPSLFSLSGNAVLRKVRVQLYDILQSEVSKLSFRESRGLSMLHA